MNNAGGNRREKRVGHGSCLGDFVLVLVGWLVQSLVRISNGKAVLEDCVGTWLSVKCQVVAAGRNRAGYLHRCG